jgi:hypothetical protein
MHSLKGINNNSNAKSVEATNRISGNTHDVSLHDNAPEETKNQSAHYGTYVKLYSLMDVLIMFIMTVYCICALSQDAMSFSEIGFEGITHSLTHSLTHLLTHSLTYLLTHSLTHLLTHTR